MSLLTANVETQVTKILPMYVGVHAIRHFCHMLIKLHSSQGSLVKTCNKEVHKNPSSRVRVVPCKRTDRREVIIFCNFANIQTTKIQKQKRKSRLKTIYLDCYYLLTYLLHGAESFLRS